MREQKKCKKTNEKGITLIALIISIIVMIILAGVSINAIVGDNGIITEAIRAEILTRYTSYLEDLGISAITDETIICSGENMQDYISSITEDDLDNFVIIGSKLYYIGTDEEELEVAESLGINTSLSGGNAEDIKAIVQNILPEEGVAGKKLYDRTTANSEIWAIVIDYDKDYEETGEYGTGYYYLTAGTYTINDETITLEENYIIYYESLTLIALSSRHVLWSLDTSIAVTEGLVLNIDPTNMDNIEYEEVTVTDDAVAVANGEESATAYQLYEDGEDLGITMYGDVVYDEENSALVFNESDDNVLLESGEEAGGGYLKLEKDDDSIDFSDGFSFEIYVNLSRGTYSAYGYSKLRSGIFCRIAGWDNSAVTTALRFGLSESDNGLFLKFNSSSSWNGKINTLNTGTAGEIMGDGGISLNSDIYLTYIYRVYDESIADDYQKSYYEENGEQIDKVECYLNGALYAYTYYGSDSYLAGLEVWNDPSCAFYLGICPFANGTWNYYLKGSVYTTRLYTYSMTEDEVSENYSMTLKYRNSFAN